MTEPVFAAEPARLLIAAVAGILLLLLLIIKLKIHPVLSLLISALFIGLGTGMPVPILQRSKASIWQSVPQRSPRPGCTICFSACC